MLLHRQPRFAKKQSLNGPAVLTLGIIALCFRLTLVSPNCFLAQAIGITAETCASWTLLGFPPSPPAGWKQKPKLLNMDADLKVVPFLYCQPIY